MSGKKHQYNVFGEFRKIVDRQGNRYIESLKDGIVTGRQKIDDVPLKEPLLTGLFIADLISSYEEIKNTEGRSAGQRFKSEIAKAFDLSVKNINQAIRRYFTRMHTNEMKYSVPCKPIKCNFGSLDNDNEYSEIGKMVNNIRTIPEQFRQEKVEAGIQAIGLRFGHSEKHRKYYLQLVKNELEKENL